MNKQDILKEMEAYALKYDVPIIEPSGLELLLNLISQENPKRILEIGTAIGYSSAHMHFKTGAEVYTIERDQDMYKQACINHEKLELSAKINRIYADALEVDNSEFGEFDVLYIDAAKAQNRKFLDKFEQNLKIGGVVILDNLLFHGWTYTDPKDIPTRNLRQLVRKINDFINYISNNPNYEFTLLEEGDGIGIIRRKGEKNE